MKTKITILFVYHSLSVGGTEKELIAYISHLNRDNYDIHLALTRVSGELLQDLPPYAHVHHTKGDSITPNIQYLFNLYRTIQKIKPSIVVGFMQDCNFNILLLKLITNLKYKVIASEQIILSEWQNLQQTPLLKRVLVAFLYRHADVCVGQTEPILKDLADNFGVSNQNLYIIPNYVIPKIFRQYSKKQTLQTLQPYFLYVGRLAPEKNADLLLRAFYKIAQNHKGVRMVIVGPHEHTPYPGLCRSLGIGDRVKFVGYVSNVTPYYRSSTALIIPSSVEGRSRVMIEAMIAGCPVISSDFVGSNSYFTHMVDGLVFKNNSLTNLANQMNYALTHPNSMRVMAECAEQNIKKIYARKLFPAYQKSINTVMNRVNNS